MLMLCRFRHIFGVERQGIHSLRVFDVAIVDVIGTIVGGIFIAKYFGINMFATIAALFVLGIVMHRLFCVDSTFNMFLFGRVVPS
jgi:uncharacterized membrane protein YcaP (DUF421 family)